MSQFLTRVVPTLAVPFLSRPLTSNHGLVTKVRRETFVRTYPTTLVQADGSTITVRYPLPRKIVKLPIDPATCSAADLKRVQEIRRPREKMESFEEFNTTFDPMKYVKGGKK